jgi:hypothetical protein
MIGRGILRVRLPERLETALLRGKRHPDGAAERGLRVRNRAGDRRKAPGSNWGRKQSLGMLTENGVRFNTFRVVALQAVGQLAQGGPGILMGLPSGLLDVRNRAGERPGSKSEEIISRILTTIGGNFHTPRLVVLSARGPAGLGAIRRRFDRLSL